VIEQTDDEVGETYWKVVHGIRLTGMPGFKGDRSDTQAWEVSLSLANADHLPDSIKNGCASHGPAAFGISRRLEGSAIR
jgi:hypothetical protein